MAIAHRRIGTGPVRVIVLHDWFGTSANWGSVLDHLDPEGFSYAFLDYRGYGERRDVPGRYSLGEIADDVLELADQLGWDTFSSSAIPWAARRSSRSSSGPPSASRS